MIGQGVIGIGIGAVGVMGVALWWVGNKAVDEFEKRTRAEMQLEIQEQTLRLTQEKQQALASLQADFQERMKANEAATAARIEDLTKKLATAKADAGAKPIQFGDDLLREFIRVDCLFNLGAERASDREERDACGREAGDADPAGSGFYFAAFTPIFWRRAAEICNDLDDFTSSEDRREILSENPTFDFTLCDETIVAVTPETAQYLTLFLNRIEAYSLRLIEVANERGAIIDQLARTPNPLPDQATNGR